MVSWLDHAPSGCSRTRFLTLETQWCLTSGESLSMDLGINCHILLSRNVCFMTGSCCTGWDGSVIISRDSMTQALSGGVLDTASYRAARDVHLASPAVVGKFLRSWDNSSGKGLLEVV